jgi:hypothetical protein
MKLGAKAIAKDNSMSAVPIGNESSTPDAQDEMASIEREKMEETAINTNGSQSTGIEDATHDARSTMYENSDDEDEIQANQTTTSQQQQHGHRQSKSLRSLHSHHSYTDGYTYTAHDEEQRPKISRRGTEKTSSSEDHFTVTWDGDSDPLNPRSMTKGRRWAILLICAASSLCV